MSCGLKPNLTKDKIYRVSFNISLADSSIEAIQNLSAYISIANPYTNIGSYEVLNYNPQITNQNSILSDTANWVNVSGRYKAIGGEQYITIGNFEDDSNTIYNSINTNGTVEAAYYYIDDVSVIRLYDKDIAAPVLQHNAACYTSTDSLQIKFHNNGTDSLDFAQAPLNIITKIRKNGILNQTVTQTLSSNQFNPIPGQALPPDSSCWFTLKPVDFSENGVAHQVNVKVNLLGDQRLSNNALDTVIIPPQQSFGKVSASDTAVCFGTTVLLNAQQVVGSAQWQLSSNQTTWQNLMEGDTVMQTPQATTYYRLRVCVSPPKNSTV